MFDDEHNMKSWIKLFDSLKSTNTEKPRHKPITSKRIYK